MTTQKLLIEKYSWLNKVNTVEEYISPEYYNKLLKNYTFDGKTDLEQFEQFLKNKIIKNNPTKVLELGCGSGRITDAFLKVLKPEEFSAVDLSKKMLDFCKEKFDIKINYINKDIIDFIINLENKFDFIFSMWSFSHSTHQILHKYGEQKGEKLIEKAMNNLINNCMNSNAYFYLVHFDSKSEEQKILMKQWKKVFPIFVDLENQSPSKVILDKLFNKLEKKGIIELQKKHFIGKKIVYNSVNEALEIFLNFHMETYFNKHALLPEVINELIKYFKKFEDDEGKIRIKPGCFIYKIKRY